MEVNTLDTRPMTLGDWMLTILVLAIPLVNIVMYIYWAFSSTGNVNRKTFCQASLLWFAIIVCGIVAIGLIGGFFGVLLGGL